MEIASRTALGGVEGVSTNKGFIIRKVFSDGVYLWAPSPTASNFETVADIASRTVVSDVSDGFESHVQTNGLTYIVRNGAYVPASFQITVADESERDLLTEMEDNQRVYLEDQKSVDTYDLANAAWVEGEATFTLDTFAEIQAPSEYTVGDNITVTSDPDETLNGEYEVLGAAAGQPGVYFDKG